jgi:hypothetical protein
LFFVTDRYESKLPKNLVVYFWRFRTVLESRAQKAEYKKQGQDVGCSGEHASGLVLGSAEWSKLQCQILGSRVKFILGRDGSADDGRLGQDLRHFNRGLTTRNMQVLPRVKPSAISRPGSKRVLWGDVTLQPIRLGCCVLLEFWKLDLTSSGMQADEECGTVVE